MALLLAKGDDFASWRGVEEFSVAYREAAVKLASRRSPDNMVQTLALIEELAGKIDNANSLAVETVENIFRELATASEHNRLRQLLTQFYDTVYGHFSLFGSPSALFSMTNQLLCELSACCLRLARQHVSGKLPPVCLIAMGPAGRREATRYCRLQLALIWDDTDVSEEQMEQFGEELAAWFRVCGIPLEEGITPLQPDWRGSLSRWQERLEDCAARHDRAEMVEILRLADRTVLADEGDVAERFGVICQKVLGQRVVAGNLVERCMALSNGIGMMGHLKLERSGPHRGGFSLLDHAFMPLAAAVAAICLMHKVDIVGTPERLRGLVRNGKLDVVLAEKTLNAWYFFSAQRLSLELTASPGQDCRDILHLMPSETGAAEVEKLRLSLETVADLQRYMQVSFGAYT